MWKRLVSDFHKIVSVLREEGLIKRNVSRYDFYIIRICSRKRIQPRELTKGEGLSDLKNGKTRCRFKEQLYGTVYQKLHGVHETGAQDMIGTIEREN